MGNTPPALYDAASIDAQWNALIAVDKFANTLGDRWTRVYESSSIVLQQVSQYSIFDPKALPMEIELAGAMTLAELSAAVAEINEVGKKALIGRAVLNPKWLDKGRRIKKARSGVDERQQWMKLVTDAQQAVCSQLNAKYEKRGLRFQLLDTSSKYFYMHLVVRITPPSASANIISAPSLSSANVEQMQAQMASMQRQMADMSTKLSQYQTPQLLQHALHESLPAPPPYDSLSRADATAPCSSSSLSSKVSGFAEATSSRSSAKPLTVDKSVPSTPDVNIGADKCSEMVK